MKRGWERKRRGGEADSKGRDSVKNPFTCIHLVVPREALRRTSKLGYSTHTSTCRLGALSVSTLKRGTSGRSEVKWGEVKHGREEEGGLCWCWCLEDSTIVQKIWKCSRMSYCTVDFRMNWMDTSGNRLNRAMLFVCGRYARGGRGGKRGKEANCGNPHAHTPSPLTWSVVIPVWPLSERDMVEWPSSCSLAWLGGLVYRELYVFWDTG